MKLKEFLTDILLMILLVIIIVQLFMLNDDENYRLRVGGSRSARVMRNTRNNKKD